MTQLFGGGDIQQRGKFTLFALQEDFPLHLPSLVGHPDLLIRKILSRVLDLLTGMILKRVCESIFFQINKITPSLKIKKRWQIF